MDLKSCFVIVEAESGAVVANLVKYWYCLEKGLVDRPLILFHLYSQSTANNLGSQRELWIFFNSKMEKTFPGRFQGLLYPYDMRNVRASLVQATQKFEEIIKIKKDINLHPPIKLIKRNRV